MKYSGDGASPDVESVDKIRGELMDLQKRFILLFKASGQSLEQIRSTVESSLKARANEPTQMGRTGERDNVLQDLVKIVERTQRYVQLAGKPPLGSVSADALQIEYQSWAGNVSTSSSHHSVGDYTAMERRVKSLQQERDDIKGKLQESEESNAKLQRKLKAITQKYDHLLRTTKEVRDTGGAGRARTLSPSTRNDTSKLSHAAPLSSSSQNQKDSARLCSHRHSSSNDGAGDATFVKQATSPRDGSLEAMRQDNVSLRAEVVRLKEELRQSQEGYAAISKQGSEDMGSLLMKITGLKQELVLEERQRSDALLLLGETKREKRRLEAQVEELKKRLVQVQQPGCGATDLIPVESFEKDVASDLERELVHTQQFATMQVMQAKELTQVLGRMQDFLHASFLRQKKLVAELERAGKGCKVAPSQHNSARVQEGCAPANKMGIEGGGAISPRVPPGEAKGRRILKASDDSDSSDLNNFCERVLTVGDVGPLAAGKRDDATSLRSQNSELMKENQQLHDALSKLSMMYRSVQQRPKASERLVMDGNAVLTGIKRGGPPPDPPSTRKAAKEQARRDNAKPQRCSKKDKPQPQPRNPARREESQTQIHQHPRVQRLRSPQSDPPLQSPSRGQDSHSQLCHAATPGQEVMDQYDTKLRQVLSSPSQTDAAYNQSPSVSPARDDRSSSLSSTSTAKFLRRLAEFRFPKEGGTASAPNSGGRNRDADRDFTRNFSPPRLSYIKPT